MELEGGLHRIACVIGANKPLYQHVLCGEDAIVWVDAGIDSTPQRSLLPYAAKMGWDGAQGKGQIALITHADVDHYGGLPAMCDRAPHMVAMAHRLDVPWIVSREKIMRERYRMHAGEGIDPPAERIAQLAERGGPDRKRIACSLTGGETLHLGAAGDWRVLHVPGHTPGHLALWEERRRWAIIADAALGDGMREADGRLAAPPPYYDYPAYVRSVRAIADLRPERLYTSHFPVWEGKEAGRFLKRSLTVAEQLDGALRNLFARDMSFTLVELCEQIGHIIEYWPASSWSGLADPISAHLRTFLANGQIRRLAAKGQVAWKRSG